MFGMWTLLAAIMFPMRGRSAPHGELDPLTATRETHMHYVRLANASSVKEANMERAA